MNWPAVDPILEAGDDSPAKRAQRASRAGAEVYRSYAKTEDAAAQQLLTRLMNLKTSLQQRLGATFLTDFKRSSLESMLASVDQLIATTTKGISDDIKTVVDKAADLGGDNALVPITAAQLKPTMGLPSTDVPLVQAAYGNLVDLLTPPMQQFAVNVKQAVRRVALATDGRQGEINRLRDLIQGQGFDNAAYRAERIVRTELGRTFNEATYARLVELAKQFPFIRKCWRCTRDSRTRIGHVQAAAEYAKGKGIPISEKFKLKVYDERPHKAPVLIGTALLRFPIDPLVTPEGRIGAAATIMCRCNAFVDFDLAAFADHTKAQVSKALQGVTPPPGQLPPVPAPKLVPGLDFPSNTNAGYGRTAYYQGKFFGSQKDAERWAKNMPGTVVASFKRSGGTWYGLKNDKGQWFGPKGWTDPQVKTPKPKVVVPKVPKHTVPVGVPVAKVPDPVKAARGPKGVKVSDHLKITLMGQKETAAIEAALAKLDSVHGDGVLPAIPVSPTPRRGKFKNVGAFYMHNGRGRAISLGFTSKLLKQTPNLTVFHETGHFLDDQAFGDGAGVYGSQGADPQRHDLGSKPGVKAALDNLRDAMLKSRSYQTLVKWSRADTPAQGIGIGTRYQVGGYDGPDIKSGQDGVPSARDIQRPMLEYLMRSKETFARAYAQYIAVKSGDPAALKELANAQAASAQAVKGVQPGMTLVETPAITGRKHVSGTFSYPWQWTDDDFAPIERAFDQLFEAAGWRK